MLYQIIRLISGQKPIEKSLEETVSFCDSCGQVCTTACWAKALYVQIGQQRQLRPPGF